MVLKSVFESRRRLILTLALPFGEAISVPNAGFGMLQALFELAGSISQSCRKPATKARQYFSAKPCMLHREYAPAAAIV